MCWDGDALLGCRLFVSGPLLRHRASLSVCHTNWCPQRSPGLHQGFNSGLYQSVRTGNTRCAPREISAAPPTPRRAVQDVAGDVALDGRRDRTRAAQLCGHQRRSESWLIHANRAQHARQNVLVMKSCSVASLFGKSSSYWRVGSPYAASALWMDMGGPAVWVRHAR